MSDVAILGLGLMGGSLGLALKKCGVSVRVFGYARREESRSLALKKGMIDLAFDTPSDAVEEADVVVLCVPIFATESLVEACRSALRVGTVVTDVGSTKGYLMERLSKQLKDSGAHFVGSHPIAGSEMQGLKAARADLYDGAIVVITPPPSASGTDESLKRIVDLWESVKAVTRVLTAEDHDRILARTSHLPHLAAVCLSATVGREGGANLGAYCGTGFRDASRIANGSPEVWSDIVKSNADALLEETRAFRAELEIFEKLLADQDFEATYAYLDKARGQRQSLLSDD